MLGIELRLTSSSTNEKCPLSIKIPVNCSKMCKITGGKMVY